MNLLPTCIGLSVITVGWSLAVALVKGRICLSVLLGAYAALCWLAWLAFVLIGAIVAASLFAVYGTVFTWLWWCNRRKGRGKRALKQLGAKSKARVEALARQMTPSPIPAPVGGAS